MLGFQLGKSTYNEVRAKLPDEVKVEQDDGVPDTFYGGPTFFTSGTGYGIDGLKVVHFCFDKKQTLAHVGMNIEDRSFNDIKKILSSNYEYVRSEYPDAFLLFKANCDYVYLRLPRDNKVGFGVDYVTGVTYRRKKLWARQTAKDKMVEEREEKREQQKALERDAAKF